MALPAVTRDAALGEAAAWPTREPMTQAVSRATAAPKLIVRLTNPPLGQRTVDSPTCRIGASIRRPPGPEPMSGARRLIHVILGARLTFLIIVTGLIAAC